MRFSLLFQKPQLFETLVDSPEFKILHYRQMPV